MPALGFTTRYSGLDRTLGLACLVGGLVMLQAYAWPFPAMVVGG
jgi:hypothetical protein